MRILDRYIIRSLALIFLACVFVFLSLYVVIDVFTKLDDFLKNSFDVGLVINYYLTFLPSIFVQVSPYCVFLATIFTFSRLNRENEIIAMRASVQSIWQITKHIMFFGAILSFFIFMINEKIVPVTQAIHEDIDEKIESSGSGGSAQIIKNIYFYGVGNRLIYAYSFQPKDNTLQQINILEQDNKQNVISKVIAERAVWKDNAWTFYKCLVYDYFRDGEPKHEPYYFEEKQMDILENPKKLLQQKKRIELMNTAQLSDYILRISKSGAVEILRDLRVDLYQKYASPFSCLVLIFLAIPFSFLTGRRHSGINSLGIFLATSFLYYLFSVVGIALGKEAILTPFFAVWLAPMIFLGLSIYLIERMP